MKIYDTRSKFTLKSSHLTVSTHDSSHLSALSALSLALSRAHTPAPELECLSSHRGAHCIFPRTSLFSVATWRRRHTPEPFFNIPFLFAATLSLSLVPLLSLRLLYFIQYNGIIMSVTPAAPNPQASRKMKRVSVHHSAVTPANCCAGSCARAYA